MGDDEHLKKKQIVNKVTDNAYNFTVPFVTVCFFLAFIAINGTTSVALSSYKGTRRRFKRYLQFDSYLQEIRIFFLLAMLLFLM